MSAAEEKLEAVKAWHWGHPKDPNGGQDPESCKVSECWLCSVLLCPHNEPLHLHHDGCPAEALPHPLTPECGPGCNHELQEG